METRAHRSQTNKLKTCEGSPQKNAQTWPLHQYLIKGVHNNETELTINMLQSTEILIGQLRNSHIEIINTCLSIESQEILLRY